MTPVISTFSSESVAAGSLAVRPDDAGQPVILLVEDDLGLRRLLRVAVSYAIQSSTRTPDLIEAADSCSALAIARTLLRPIDLLITDIRLGSGPSGLDVARELSRTNPEMEVLLMSANDLPESDLPPG